MRFLRAAQLACILCAAFSGCRASRPQWVDRAAPGGEDTARYLFGVGSCSTEGRSPAASREAAFKRACSEIASQLRSRVEALWREHSLSLPHAEGQQGGSFFLSEKAVHTGELLEGARILGVFNDREQKQLYVLAAVDRKALGEKLKSSVSHALAEREQLLAAYLKARSEKRYTHVLLLRQDLGALDATLRRNLALLRILGEHVFEYASRLRGQGPIPPPGCLLVVTCTGGNRQRGFAGEPLAGPLSVRAEFRSLEREGPPLPAAGVTLLVREQTGLPVEVEPGRVATDHSGRASFSIRRLPPLRRQLSLLVTAEGLPARDIRPARISVDILTPSAVRYGLLVQVPVRDQAGAGWILRHLRDLLEPITPFCEVKVIAGQRQDPSRVFRCFRSADLVVEVRVRVDILLVGQATGVSFAEARLSVGLWDRWGRRYLRRGGVWSGGGRAQGDLDAAAAALNEAVLPVRLWLERSLTELLGPVVPERSVGAAR